MRDRLFPAALLGFLPREGYAQNTHREQRSPVMTAFPGKLGTCLLVCVGLTACGGGGSGSGEGPINIDYSSLHVAESRDTPLESARTDEDVLAPLRNGLRMNVAPTPMALPAGTVTPAVTSQT